MSRRTRFAASTALALALAGPAAAAAGDEPPPPPRKVEAPELRHSVTEPSWAPGVAWLVGELVPSPALAFGDRAPSFGLRFQVTPVLWSWGVHRAVSPWRFAVVDPIARVSGSLELYGTYDWFFGGVHDTLMRPGIRTTVPLLHRGEYLAASFGTSFYDREKARVAWDAGFWILSGFLGATATLAPADDRVRTIATIHLRVLH